MFKEATLTMFFLSVLLIYGTDGCSIRSLTNLLSSDDDSDSSESDEDFMDAFLDVFGLSDKDSKDKNTTTTTTTTSTTTTEATTTTASTTTAASTTAAAGNATTTTEKPK